MLFSVPALYPRNSSPVDPAGDLPNLPQLKLIIVKAEPDIGGPVSIR